jgi:selenide,water dikinase
LLEQILADIPVPPDPEGRIIHGFSNNEDAVLVKSPPAGMVLVQTVDILGPIGNNARLFGQTAAANALSDVYAMGGVPWSVMNVAAFPSPEKPEDAPITVLAEILAGAMEKVAEAGAVLAGGHTLDDELIKFGLAVTGAVRPEEATRNNALVPGDVLILTKPLGTGVLATAIKAKWPGFEEAEKEPTERTSTPHEKRLRRLQETGWYYEDYDELEGTVYVDKYGNEYFVPNGYHPEFHK